MKTGTKILIGVALAGAVGYLLWKRSQNKKSTGAANTAVGGVPRGSATGVIIDPKMVEIKTPIKGQANTVGSTRGGGVRVLGLLLSSLVRCRKNAYSTPRRRQWRVSCLLAIKDRS